jgi:hypothetical protein
MDIGIVDRREYWWANERFGWTAALGAATEEAIVAHGE